MAKTTIIFDVTAGAEQNVKPTSITIRPSTRLSLKTGVVLPAPTSVYIENGTASRTIEASPADNSWAWEFQEFAPGYVGKPTARVVPQSSVPVQYRTLEALVSPPDEGFGPSWAGYAQESAARAELAMVTVEALIDGIPQQVSMLVPGYVAAAIAADPDFSSAASDAVATAVNGLDLFKRTDPGAPRVVTNLPGILYAVLDSEGFQTFMVADSIDGGPNAGAAGLIFSRLTFARIPSQTVTDLAKGIEPFGGMRTGASKMDGVLMPVVSDIDSSTPYLLWTTVGDDGGPIPYWVNDFKNRLATYGGWVTESMLTTALQAKLNGISANVYTPELSGGSLFVNERTTGNRKLISSTGAPSNAQIAADGWVIFDTTDGRMARKADGTGLVLSYATLMSYYSAWGDSLTANYPLIGADQPNTYAAKLSGLLGLGTVENTNYYNGGRGGQHIEEIAARQGGIPLYAAASVNVPAAANAAVAVTLDRTINAYTSQVWDMVVVFGGIPGTLRRLANGNSYTFERTTSGAATTVASGTRFTPVNDARKLQFQTFAGLMNDLVHEGNISGNSAAIVTRGLNAVKAMADYLPAYNKRYLTIGTITRSDWTTGNAFHTTVLNYHAGLAAQHGDRFVDVRSMIIANAATIAADQGITLTGPDTSPGTDLYNLARDTLPPSFMHDVTHYYGFIEGYIATWLYNRAVSKGWAS